MSGLESKGELSRRSPTPWSQPSLEWSALASAQVPVAAAEAAAAGGTADGSESGHSVAYFVQEEPWPTLAHSSEPFGCWAWSS